jgi:hypothetical protein
LIQIICALAAAARRDAATTGRAEGGAGRARGKTGPWRPFAPVAEEKRFEKRKPPKLIAENG